MIFKSEKQKALEKKEYEKLDAYKKIFNTPEGEIVLKDLVSICGVTISSVDADANMTFYNEGKRFVGMHILRTLETEESYIRFLYNDMNNIDIEQGEQYE